MATKNVNHSATLPEEVRELAMAAAVEVGGLARAALLLQDAADSGRGDSVELGAALRHVLRRIGDLSDGVLFPLINTGVDRSYDADDFALMQRTMGVEPQEASHG
jgi:uncharacterized membrane protein